MKLKNIGNKDLKIVFTPKNKKSIIVDLKPGQIVYAETDSIDNKRILIIQRKGKLEITENDKPNAIEYYKPYGVMSHADVENLKRAIKKPTIVIDEKDEEEDEDVDLDEMNETKTIKGALSKDDEDEFKISDDEDEDTFNDSEEKEESKEKESVSKNKGGRPKGSLNKKKKRKTKTKTKSNSTE